MVREAIVLRSLGEGGEERYEFPINPPNISITDGLATTKVPIIKLGQINLPGALSVIALSFETFLPRYYDATLCNYENIEEPETSFTRLQRWMGRQASDPEPVPPTRLRTVITDVGFSREMMLTQVQGDYRGGEPDKMYVRIRLEDWPVQKLRISSGAARPAAEAYVVPQVVSTPTGADVVGGTAEQRFTGATERDDPRRFRTGAWVTRRGDSLVSIAVRLWGESGRGNWVAIYNANREVLAGILPSSNPTYVLDDGIPLQIPEFRDIGIPGIGGG